MPDFKGLSPMLRHSLESFEHGIFHYLEKTELGRKFALLHVDHSIELILKEKVVCLGQSVYRKDGKTISIHKAYTALETSGVSIPEKPRLEDLHDFRNVVQHKGLTPDEHTTEFYVNEAYRFVKRFLHDELGLQLDTYLPRSYMKTIEGIETEEEKAGKDVNKRLSEAEAVFAAGAYESAIVSAYVALERAVRSKLNDDRQPLNVLVQRLVDEGHLSNRAQTRLRLITDLRNRAAHTGDTISGQQARQTLNTLKAIIAEISDA